MMNLTIDDIIIPTRCPVLGIPLQVNDGGCGPNSPTLDRIDSAKGYVRGNVIVVSFKANTIKSNATVQELRAVADFYSALTHLNPPTIDTGVVNAVGTTR